MPPKFNRRRALFVLTKIDEILAWEQLTIGCWRPVLAPPWEKPWSESEWLEPADGARWQLRRFETCSGLWTDSAFTWWEQWLRVVPDVVNGWEIFAPARPWLKKSSVLPGRCLPLHSG